MTQYFGLCPLCAHFGRLTVDDLPDDVGQIVPDGPFCAAFPHGIPKPILRGGQDHLTPMKGDRGIQFELGDPDDAGTMEYLLRRRETVRAMLSSKRRDVVPDPRNVVPEVHRLLMNLIEQLRSGDLWISLETYELQQSGSRTVVDRLEEWAEKTEPSRGSESHLALPFLHEDGSPVVEDRFRSHSDPQAVGYVSGSDSEHQLHVINAECQRQGITLSRTFEDVAPPLLDLGDSDNTGLRSAIALARSQNAAVIARSWRDIQPHVDGVLFLLAGTQVCPPALLTIEEDLDTTSAGGCVFAKVAALALDAP